jgi:hypothetical protein
VNMSKGLPAQYCDRSESAALYLSLEQCHVLAVCNMYLKGNQSQHFQTRSTCISAMKVEAGCSSKMTADFQRTTWCYTREDWNFSCSTYFIPLSKYKTK